MRSPTLAIAACLATGGLGAPVAADPLSDPCETMSVDAVKQCESWELLTDAASAGWVATRDGRVFIVGSFAAALDEATGNPLWSVSPGGASADLSPDGATVYILRRASLSSMILRAIDTATGSERWVRTYTDSRLAMSGAKLTVSSDGSALVLAAGVLNRGFASAFAIGTDALGNERWRHLFAPSADRDDPVGLAATPTAAYVALERSGVYRFDPVRGVLAWRASYTGQSDLRGAHAVAFDGVAGRLFVVGGWVNNIGVEAFDAGAGTSQWTATFDGAGVLDFDYPAGIALSPDGSRVFATGSSRETVSGVDFVVLAYDAATGEAGWLGRYAGFDGADDHPNALAVSADGQRVTVTGVSSHIAAAYRTCSTAGFDTATGSLLWSARAQGHAAPRLPAFESRCRAVAAGTVPTRFVVGGETWDGSTYDALHIAYDR